MTKKCITEKLVSNFILSKMFSIRRVLCLPDEDAPHKPKTKTEILTHFMETSTTHGLGNIYHAKKILNRLFWILAFLAFFSVLIYQIYVLGVKFNSHAHVTRVYNEVQDNGIQFPAVTICNANPFPIEKITATLYALYPNVTNWTDSVYQEKIEDFQLQALNFNLTQLASLGVAPENLFIAKRCFFANKACSYPSDFRLYSNANDGNCFTFNQNGSHRQHRSGVKYGLSVILNINRSSYSTHLISKNIFPVGAYISIHEAGKLVDFTNRAILVAPNQLSRISVRKKTIQRLKDPYRDNCTNGFSDTVSSAVGGYTVDTCLLSCYVQKLFDYCKVVDVPSAIGWSKVMGIRLPPARTQKDMLCLERFDSIYNEGKVKCHCNAPCYEEIYEKSVSAAAWPTIVESDEYIQSFKQEKNITLTQDYIMNNFLSVQVYYDDFTIEKTVHEPEFDNNKFFSELGGQLGLWIGASFFSLIEFGGMIWQVITNYFAKKKKQKEKKVGEFP